MLSIVLPTYNEVENLPVITGKIRDVMGNTPYEVIVVDDDSPDGTWRVGQRIAQEQQNVRVIRRVGRRGLSSAVIEGFLAAKGDIFAVADADGQHDLAVIPKLHKTVENGGGIALGSRYTEGGGMGEWDERRQLMSRLATWLAIKLCKVTVTDPMSGLFAIDRKTFEEALPRLNPKGFKILLDLLVHAPRGVRVAEIPFTFGARMHGESKLSRRVQVEFLEYLYEAAFGRFLPLTLIEYCVVGAMGVAIHLSTYFIVSRLVLGEAQADLLGFSVPLLSGVEAAILFNFLLNNSWTFGYAKLRGWNAVIGFIRYNIVCTLGALANIAVTSYLYTHGISELLSLTVGGFLGTVWNYTMSRLFTWKV